MNQKILVVEDEKFMRQIIINHLLEAGLKAIGAQDGKQALDTLKDFSPDLIMLDLVMPNMDGFDLLSKIKSKPSLKNIPVIVTSNLSQEEDRIKAIDMGASSFIIKSNISISDIVKKVKNTLKNH